MIHRRGRHKFRVKRTYDIKQDVALPERESIKTVTISIGEYYASLEPVVISTFLGSCVSACLYEPGKHIGGMNHILVPGKPDLNKNDMSARYGVNAMELLINAMMTLGSDKKKITAKVFGGANVIPGIPEESSMGAKISEFVLLFLKNEGIRVINSDLGGVRSRKLFFHTETGDVYLRHGPSMKSVSILAEERKKMELVKKEAKKPTKITLF